MRRPTAIQATATRGVPSLTGEHLAVDHGPIRAERVVDNCYSAEHTGPSLHLHPSHLKAEFRITPPVGWCEVVVDVVLRFVPTTS
jgi:hypothetical protein